MLNIFTIRRLFLTLNFNKIIAYILDFNEICINFVIQTKGITKGYPDETKSPGVSSSQTGPGQS